MIEYFYELEFRLEAETVYSNWLDRVVRSEECTLGDLSYIFCSDAYLLNLNQEFLKHDTYTDIISFDYSEGSILSGDIFISIGRVRENCDAYRQTFSHELLRVMAHGILHLMGYNDKSREESLMMRIKEDEKIQMFHVEQLE